MGWGGGPGRSLQGWIDLNTLQAQGFPWWVWRMTGQRLNFVLLWREFWVPLMSGTGCNKPQYFLFCLLRWLAHVLLNNYSETTRRKQIPWAFGETTWNLCAPAFQHVPFPSPSPPLANAAPFPNEKSWMLWLKAGTSKQGADSLWNCLPSTS